ncbi:hypothetical protein BDZ91DRAFT_710712 [Kalaharituber pfeilii]|nr:hypothetical protein BDZ91DRAFT_710712 [Kalaharituber pfeilii]
MSDDTQPPVPTNAEDLKRQKALSAMESTSIVADDSAAPSSSTSTANPEALGAALGSITAAAAAAAPPKPATSAVKIKAEDVALVMDQFELTKPKATDALRRNGGDIIVTLRALVTAS